MNNLKLGIAIANLDRGIKPSLIYDELEAELYEIFGSNVLISQIDFDENTGLHAASVDFIVEFIIDNYDQLKDIIKIANICWKLHQKHIKDQKKAAPSSGIVIMDMNNPESNLILDKEYTEKHDYIDDIVNQIYYTNEKN